MFQEALLPLMDIQAGETVQVKSLAGDRALCARLASLGFTPGTAVTLCPSCAAHGSRKVLLRDCPIVIDEQAAASVLCTRTVGPCSCTICTGNSE